MIFGQFKNISIYDRKKTRSAIYFIGKLVSYI